MKNIVTKGEMATMFSTQFNNYTLIYTDCQYFCLDLMLQIRFMWEKVISNIQFCIGNTGPGLENQ